MKTEKQKQDPRVQNLSWVRDTIIQNLKMKIEKKTKTKKKLPTRKQILEKIRKEDYLSYDDYLKAIVKGNGL